MANGWRGNGTCSIVPRRCPTDAANARPTADVKEVDKWYDDLTLNGRIAFEGKPTLDPISSLKNKRIPPRYRQKGALNPFMYEK